MKGRTSSVARETNGERPRSRRWARIAWASGLFAGSLVLAAYVHGGQARVAETVVEPGTAWVAAILAEDGALVRLGSSVLTSVREVADAWDRVGTVASAGATGPASLSRAELDAMLERAEWIRSGFKEVARLHEHEIAPLERVLLQYRHDPALVRRIARALFVEARNVGVEPRLLLAVLLVENPWLDTTIRSEVGAVGLMQVMPMHEGKWPPCEPDLEDVDANICHGARIFAHYFRAENGDMERALLRYNGCVRGTNTPDCHRYPYHVYARAGRASILAWTQTERILDAFR